MPSLTSSPVIDILLATCNGQNYLEDQVHSIFNQSYPHFRLIVRDDCSNDETPKLLLKFSKFSDKIKIFWGESRQGAIYNFQQLLKQSVSPYIMLADQDDIWLKDKIALSLAKIQEVEQKNKNFPILVHTDLCVVDENLKIIASSFWKYSKFIPTTSFNRLLVQNTITGCTCMLNRSLANILNFHSSKKVIMHDWWIALVASAFGKIVSLKEAPILYRQHQSNLLGAKKMSTLKYLQKGFKLLKSKDSLSTYQRYEQAKNFYEAYYSHLNLFQKQMLQAFFKAPEVAIWKRKYYFFKYEFFWQKTLRNLTRFCLKYPY